MVKRGKPQTGKHRSKGDPTNKGGRPSKFTPERVAMILQAVRVAGATFEVAARRAGITYETLNEWRKRGEAAGPDETDPAEAAFFKFSEGLKEAEAEAEFSLLVKLRAAAGGASTWQAGAWLLERRYPERYGRRSRVELTGKDGGAIRYQDDELTNEEVEKRIRAVLGARVIELE